MYTKVDGQAKKALTRTREFFGGDGQAKKH